MKMSDMSDWDLGYSESSHDWIQALGALGVDVDDVIAKIREQQQEIKRRHKRERAAKEPKLAAEATRAIACAFARREVTS